MEFKPYVWMANTTHGLNTSYAVIDPAEVEKPKLELELIQGGRAWLGREDSLLRAMRTLTEEERNETATNIDPK